MSNLRNQIDSIKNLQSQNPTSTSKNDFIETIDEAYHESQLIILQPLAMRIFNSDGVYFPSKLTPQRVISYAEFISQYADYPIKMRVCFDEKPSSDTMLARSEVVTAYGFGLDCYYLAISHMA